ncbi:MAG: hypothetical protein IT578_09350 [Verrucomicrobiae bacterium]|nr:hypothetical protein [Verrucomicrobiae bacterium]
MQKVWGRHRGEARESQRGAAARETLAASIGLSIILNLLLLALASSAGLSHLLRLSERPKPKGRKEAPTLILTPPPAPRTACSSPWPVWPT